MNSQILTQEQMTLVAMGYHDRNELHAIQLYIGIVAEIRYQISLCAETAEEMDEEHNDELNILFSLVKKNHKEQVLALVNVRVEQIGINKFQQQLCNATELSKIVSSIQLCAREVLLLISDAGLGHFTGDNLHYLLGLGESWLRELQKKGMVLNRFEIEDESDEDESALILNYKNSSYAPAFLKELLSMQIMLERILLEELCQHKKSKDFKKGIKLFRKMTAYFALLAERHNKAFEE